MYALVSVAVVLLDTTQEPTLEWTRFPYGPNSVTPGVSIFTYFFFAKISRTRAVLQCGRETALQQGVSKGGSSRTWPGSHSLVALRLAGADWWFRPRRVAAPRSTAEGQGREATNDFPAPGTIIRPGQRYRTAGHQCLRALRRPCPRIFAGKACSVAWNARPGGPQGPKGVPPAREEGASSDAFQEAVDPCGGWCARDARRGTRQGLARPDEIKQDRRGPRSRPGCSRPPRPAAL